MAFPAEELQRAIYETLARNAALVALIPPPNAKSPPRIYDEVPANVQFPYVVIGDDQLVDDTASGASWEATSTIHIFTRPSDAAAVRGKREAKKIASAIIDALGPATLRFDGFVHRTSDEFETNFQSSRFFYEPDRLTVHGVLVFGFLIDQAAED